MPNIVSPIQRKPRALDEANRRAAEIILREAEKHGHTTGLSLDWARKVLGKVAA